MYKLIIFDLDGVLIDAKHIHFETLNHALSAIDKRYVINIDEHLSIFDGLKTNQKLQLLTKKKALPPEYYEQIWQTKQRLTTDALSNIKENFDLVKLFSKLSELGYKIACCSNSIRKTVLLVLSKLGIIKYFDLILSNEDVQNSKPHPEIYWKAISKLNVLPEETLILEDSPIGLIGAHKSGASVFRIDAPKDITLDNINIKLNNTKIMNMPKWKSEKLNVLIPMAGAGSRFEAAGYTFPKPLIDINGKPMIQTIVENLNIEANYIFVVRKEHREKYSLDILLNLVAPNCKIVEVNTITEGAACTTLLAKNYIDNDCPLIMANSDQFVEWNSIDFMYKMSEQQLDAGILTFKSTHPKWSFVKLNDDNFVTEVAEKKPISDIATVGIYYWKRGSDYVRYAEQMISKNIRVNNEFYVCPVFNESILDGKKIKTYNIENMWGLGTPEDLTFFLKNYNK
jgi:beta-phosphoglucomutase-like phosphatase (HAD superfamily)/dTDP-glucose pyrophosphorylase